MKHSGQRGFTLIQISILLTVASLVMVAVLPGSQTKLTANNVSASRMNTVLTALRSFQASNGYLPCPANPYLPTGSPLYGVAAPASNNCINGTAASANTASAAYADTTNHIALGMVPVQALNLSKDYALDSFGRDITYAVDTSATSCWSAQSLPGAITVNDNGVTNNSTLALVSHGADGFGAWLPLTGASGVASRFNSGSTDIYQADNAQVTTGTLTANTTFQPFYRKSPTSTFDDIVVYKNPLWNFNNMPLVQGATVTVVPPANGNYTAGQTISFTLIFPYVVNVTGTPRLDISAASGGSAGTGNVTYANYSSGTGTNTLLFKYQIASGDTAPNGLAVSSLIDMNGGSINPVNAGSISPCTTGFTPPNLSKVVIPPACSAYSYHRQITVGSGVSGTLVNFPMLFSNTASDMATSANGGAVQNANGYDIIFSLTATGTPLNAEQEYYNAATGQVIYWVQMPSLTSGATFYACYGDANIATSQGGAQGAAWDTNFTEVMHLANGSTLNAGDSTSNAYANTVNAAAATTGKIGGGASFNGSSSYIAMAPAAFPWLSSDMTFSVWFKTSADGVILGNTDGTWPSAYPSLGWVPAIYVDTTGKIKASMFWHGTLAQISPTPATMYNDGNWHFLADTFTGNTETLYIDGASVGSQSFSPPGEVSYTANYAYFLGTAYSALWSNAASGWFYFSGSLDEVEVSKTARSAGWIGTEYNNQSAPASFYSVSGAAAR